MYGLFFALILLTLVAAGLAWILQRFKRSPILVYLALGIFAASIKCALLAREAILGRPGNLPSATGADGPRVLGQICFA